MRRGLSEMADMLIAGYVLAAHLSATRLLVRELRAPPWISKAWGPAFRAAREWLIAQLSNKQAPTDLTGPAYLGGPAVNDALGVEFQRLRKSALALMTAAAVYRSAAAQT